MCLLVNVNSLSITANEPQENKIQIIDSLNNISYNNRRSNPKQSLEYALKAYKLCQDVSYKKGHAFAIHNMGTAKAILGNYDSGMTDLIEASRIREEINDYEGLVSTYNNIGYVYSEMEDDKKALEFYNKALKQQKKTELLRDLGIVLNNIGHVHFRNNQLDSALHYFYKALEVNEEDNDERGASASKSNIGSVYRNMGEYEKGLKYHYDSYKIGKKHNDRYGMISTLRYIAEDYIYLGQIEKATNYALKSLIMAQDIGSLGEEKNTISLLARIYEKRGQHQKSNHYLKFESKLNDSLFSIEKAQVLGRLQSAYELENKAQENEFLRIEQQANAQQIKLQRSLLYLSAAFIVIAFSLLIINLLSRRKIKHSNQELLTKNQEIINQKQTIQEKVKALDDKNKELKNINQIKDKLISVIAHDLKNPFNSISGYSELLLTEPESYSTTELKTFLSIIHDNALKGNMLLDNLLQWSRLQTSTIQFVPVEQKLYKLVYDELFFAQHKAKEKEVKLLTNIPENTEVFADSNMLKTVIRNLISNALKFTPKQGQISIASERVNNGVNICVKDTGSGIEPQIKEKLFTGEAGVTTPNERGEKGTGLGLMLCKDFIDIHKGEIWVESQPNQGSSFYIFLPDRAEEES
ncbi:MAG: tetratricopeptide repeat protein [Bacteroidales bacterium]